MVDLGFGVGVMRSVLVWVWFGFGLVWALCVGWFARFWGFGGFLGFGVVCLVLGFRSGGFVLSLFGGTAVLDFVGGLI